jgi:hypothetical protein
MSQLTQEEIDHILSTLVSNSSKCYTEICPSFLVSATGAVKYVKPQLEFKITLFGGTGDPYELREIVNGVGCVYLNYEERIGSNIHQYWKIKRGCESQAREIVRSIKNDLRGTIFEISTEFRSVEPEGEFLIGLFFFIFSIIF